MENYFGNFNLFQLCYKWKWHLVIFVLIAGILGLIFSGPFFIKPKFKSVAIVYPANISKFSEESETEQMLQWFESRDIVDSMIKKFDLPKHYKIKTNDRFYMSKIYKTFDENVTIAKTKYESVKIEIYDTDPQIACDMVNSLIDFYNKKVRNIHREKYQEVLTIEESRLMEKKRQQDSLLRTINNIRTKYELIDYGIQTNEVTRGYLGTFDGSNRANVNRTEIKRIKQNIENKGDSLLLITGQLSSVCASYNNFKISYEDALRNVNKVQTFANIVTSPFPADKKSYPSRLLIVFYAMGAALFFSIITIAVIDGRKIFKN
ncbi:MAG TPA: hypothetical protein PKL64_08315 [Bacteroidales bacterium]|nr:hypothetical protein [Bacteroidales bacterium]